MTRDSMSVARSPRADDPAPPGAHPAAAGDERRGDPRLPPSALPPFTARLLDGPQVDIVNVSKTGILARSHARLLPGATIGLRFVTSDAVFVLLGKVVRSRLVGLDQGQPQYESGLAFDRHFPLLTEDPAAALASLPPEPAADTPSSAESPFPREIGRLNGNPTVLTVTTFAKGRRDDVLKAFDINDW